MALFSTYLHRLKQLDLDKHRTRLYDLVRSFQNGSRFYLKGLYQQLSDKDVFLWAQAIAFKVLITVVPVFILITGILAQVLQRERSFETVTAFIRNFLPPEHSDQLVDALTQLITAGEVFTIIGVAGLLLSAMTLFTTLRIAVGNVFQEEWHDSRSIWRGYLFDLRMAIQVGLFFLLSIGISVIVQTVNVAGIEYMEAVGMAYEWIREGWQQATVGMGLLLPFLLTTAMFFQLLYFIPKPHPPKRSVLIGSLFTGVLWEAAKAGFTFYATNVGRFDRYSGGDGARAYLGDTFGLIIAFVFWVYFSGIVLLLGAIVALLHEKAYRLRPLLQKRKKTASMPASVSPSQEQPREDDAVTSQEPDAHPKTQGNLSLS